MKIIKWLQALSIFLLSIISSSNLSALPIFVPQYTYEYKVKIVPLFNFNQSYIIIRINNNSKDANVTLYTSGLRQSDSRFQSLDLNSPTTFALGVIPYGSIVESKFYREEDNLFGLSQIKENCRNYIPTSIGKKIIFYSFAMNERIMVWSIIHDMKYLKISIFRQRNPYLSKSI